MVNGEWWGETNGVNTNLGGAPASKAPFSSLVTDSVVVLLWNRPDEVVGGGEYVDGVPVRSATAEIANVVGERGRWDGGVKAGGKGDEPTFTDTRQGRYPGRKPRPTSVF